MTDTTQDQMTLRRRARRRLVGAVAIALAAVLILPMLFDPEPRPLGPDVDIRIPATNTPFEPLPAAKLVPAEPLHPARAGHESAPQVAEPTLPPAQPSTLPPTLPVSPPEPVAKAVPASKGVEPKPKVEVSKLANKPAALHSPAKKTHPAEKKVGDAGSAKQEKEPVEKTKPLPAPRGAFASHGFYLQLGAFGNADNARQLQEKVETAGFKVDLLTSNGQYRVRVGPFPEREHAQEVHARLKAHGFTSVMIGP